MAKPQKEKNKPEPDPEDSITVAEMNVEGMPWYKTPEEVKQAKEMDSLNLSKAEKRAMMKGAFQAYLPAFLIAIGTFSLAFGLVMLWFFLAGR